MKLFVWPPYGLGLYVSGIAVVAETEEKARDAVTAKFDMGGLDMISACRKSWEAGKYEKLETYEVGEVFTIDSDNC